MKGQGRRILLFDSGTGGLTVARAVREALPQASLLYAADSAAFPYGAWDEKALVARIVAVIGRLIEETAPDIIVIACNTASTLALAELRANYTVPIVGTVPAIKPAAQQTRSGLIGVLATPSTARREYTQALIHTFAFHCTVFLHGAEHLAALAEKKLAGEAPDLEAIGREIAPVFRKREGRHTDTVVLGCTHYPLLAEEMEKVAPWKVTWIDPAPAIARRTAEVLAPLPRNGAGSGGVPPGTVILTSARGRTPALALAYERMGFPAMKVVEISIA